MRAAGKSKPMTGLPDVPSRTREPDLPDNESRA